MQLDQTQLALRDAARRCLDDWYPAARVAQVADRGYGDLDRWPQLRRLGWLDPELAVADLTVLAEEAGRALLPAPWWSALGRAVPVYRAAARSLSDPACFADGRENCCATTVRGHWLLTGRVFPVFEAGTATAIVVVARTADGAAVFEVHPAAAGLSLADLGGVDPQRHRWELSFEGTPGRLLVVPDATTGLLDRTACRAVTLLCGEAVGVAARALAFAVEHAKVRRQFGRPIGSYQAVAHQLAEAYADVELARSLTYWAAGTPDEPEALACAAYASARTAREVCESAIQVCGGMGVTWDFPLHRWYRRALWLEAFHAARPDPLAVVADTVLAGAPVPDGGR